MGVSEIFALLPEPVKRRAARSIELLVSNPRMYPVRRRGIMCGYRYFIADSVLFYYSVYLQMAFLDGNAQPDRLVMTPKRWSGSDTAKWIGQAELSPRLPSYG
jgi:hypothetical protein